VHGEHQGDDVRVYDSLASMHDHGFLLLLELDLGRLRLALYAHVLLLSQFDILLICGFIVAD